MINFEERVRIPNDLDTLEAFRSWARSDEYPQQGRYAYLDGEIRVDLSMEQPFTHNRLKTKITTALDTLVDEVGSGEVFSDGMLLSNPAANLSTEPDAMYVSFDTMQSGRVRFVEGKIAGFKELEGTPDMVLEIVSTTSIRKDTEILRDLYWRAGIPEYWLIDARGSELLFALLRYTSRGYVATRQQADGSVRSAVFGRSFRLTQRSGPLGNPQYLVEVR